MTEKKLNVAIVGPGNIGSDLLYKVERSDKLNSVLMTGIYEDSEGLRRAKDMGIDTSSKGIDAVLERTDIDLVFDSTSAYAHKTHAPLLKERGIIAVDLTPAAIGPYVVPAVNIQENLKSHNVNMVTCGGQATIPIVAAVSRVSSVEYAEIVATISSKSAGPGTRQNIDEFTRTTSGAIEVVGGAKQGKAIIILNPAEPPIMMHDTVYCELAEVVDEQLIIGSIDLMVEEVKTYVPGYHLKVRPIIEGRKVTIIVEVEGAGDFLPKYAGNLDIMTSAAVGVAERIAENVI